ncbi:hypothetical protein BCV71DRAFT_263698 [Rhizopus microsporus]|uniref:Uncharacterized protein n=1 Tax=Rhizopus microsporus TaxID=58291 RepID=A0A1X0S391_RHIZD|nr:hypothetical protein BCV71DRAFT_263698 [Rhizopus microsporus]
MDLVIDEDLFAIETISSRIQFLRNKPPEKPCNPVIYPVTDKRNNEVIDMDKCLNASAAARQSGIHIRAAQRWVKRYYEDPESIFEKKKKSGRHRILGEKHKQFLLNYIDRYPSAAVTEVAESLTQNFQGLSVSLRLGTKVAANYVFLDESAFRINLKWGMVWSKKGTPAIVTVPTTKANITSILGAISATGLINVSLRIPKRIKKRKLGCETDGYSIGTVT